MPLHTSVGKCAKAHCTQELQLVKVEEKQIGVEHQETGEGRWRTDRCLVTIIDRFTKGTHRKQRANQLKEGH